MHLELVKTYAATPYILVQVRYATLTHPTYIAFAEALLVLVTSKMLTLPKFH